MNKRSANSNDQSNSSLVPRDTLQDCNNISSLAVPGGSEVQGKTSFVQEACESVSVLGAHYMKPTVLHPSADLQDVAKYYARPRLIASGDLNPIRTVTHTYDMNQSTILNLASGTSNRVDGAYGFRATMVFTLQVAATPFHQGIAALSFQYYDGGTIWRGREPTTATNIPHVRIDISENTMVQLRVPFMAPTDFADIASTIPYGRMQLTNITPVLSPSGSATYKIYYHVEDLELYGVKPVDVETYVFANPALMAMAPAVEQTTDPVPAVTTAAFSPMPPTTVRSAPLLTRYPDTTLRASTKESILASMRQMTDDPKYVPQVEFQMGRGSMEKEFDDESKPYSSGLYSLSKTLSWVAKGIPMLSSFASPASWFAAKAAGALRAFGYARPQTIDPPMRVAQLQTIMENNVDVPSTVELLAPMATNHLAVTPAFGCTDVDEMSFAYMLSQYNQIYYGSISNTQAVGTVVYATATAPLTLFYKTDIGDIFPQADTVQPSTIMWLATMFKYWRGGMKFRFTFSKTKMHAGRVIATFIPCTPTLYNALIPSVTAIGVQTDGHSAVFDLKDSNVFEFEVPYPLYVPYLDTGATRPNGDWDESSGTLSLIIVDPLIAPDVVHPSIHFVVEVCGCSDMQFGFPVGPQFPVDVGTVPVYQSGAVLTAYDDSICTLTMGECITSAKQLIAIPKSTHFSGIVGNTPVANTYFDLPPWYFQPRDPTNYETHAYGGNLAKGFTYVKGSTDHHLFGDNRGTLFFRVRPQDGSVSALVDTASSSSMPFLQGSSGTPLHFRMPSYQRAPRMLSRALDSVKLVWNLLSAGGVWTGNPTLTPISDNDGHISPIIPRVLLYDLGGSTTTVPVLYRRQAGDDAGMAHYIGPPPIRKTPDLDVSLVGW